MTDIVIVGAGGCAREVYEMALETYPAGEYRIKGFLSDQAEDLDPFPDIREKAPIIGSIQAYVPQEEERFLLALGTPQDRRDIAVALKARGAGFLSLLHPMAKISPTARLGEGVILYPFTLVSCYVELGDFCMMNAYSGCGHDAKVGAYSVLAPYAAVLGFSEVGEGCFLSTHSMLAPKKSLGKEGMIAANSAAFRDAPEQSLVLGVPGKNM